ncbi:MAG: translation initiation factor IF-2 subunit alpha [Candidatus Diapherotrites archaeon]|nr:translation initiation factor IF-2 subunit alpha [Candidatus Diapherotrites archaeon]
MKREEFPVVGELVVVKIKNIKNYGAFVELIEYGKDGFIHVSNIASGWVKNIRSHVNEGQIRVAAVVNVDPKKNLIDVSLRKVSSSQEKRKIQEWKRAKKAEKLLERVARKLKVPMEKAWKEVGWPLEDAFGDLFAAFEAASADGMDAFKGLKIPKKWTEEIVKVAKESVSPPTVTIRGKLKMKFYCSDGLDKIKQTIKKISSKNVNVSYLGAPDYMITVTAMDYPTAEKQLKEIIKIAETEAKKNDGEVSFERLEK